MNPKHALRSRTVWFNLLAAVPALLAAVGELPRLQPYAAEMAVAIVFANIVLRAVTSEPVTLRKPSGDAEECCPWPGTNRCCQEQEAEP